LNPRDAKIRLAMELVSIFHSLEEAVQAMERFKLVYSQRDIPDDIPVIVAEASEVWLPRFFTEHGLAASTSEGRRMIQQGAVRVNGEKYQQEELRLADEMVIQIGKRKFARIKV